MSGISGLSNPATPDTEPEGTPWTQDPDEALSTWLSAESSDPISEFSASEKESLLTNAERYFWVSLYSFFACLIIVGNVLLIAILLKNKTSRRDTTTIFVVSLLLARTCIAVFVIPVRIAAFFPSALINAKMCRLCHACALMSSAASVWSTVAVALATHAKVFKLGRILKTKIAVGCVFLIWVFSFLYGSRRLVFYDFQLVEIHGIPALICTATPSFQRLSSYFVLVDFLCLFCLPLCAVMFFHVTIIKASKQHQNKVSQRKQNAWGSESWVGVVDQAPHTSSSETPTEKRLFVVDSRMLITITVLFGVCTAFPYVWRLYLYWADHVPDQYVTLEHSLHLCSYANPWLNVFVIIYFRDDIRQGIRHLCCGHSA